MEYLEIEQVTNWLLSHQSMTPKKLQKMLYYCYSWGLVFFNEDGSNIENKLFDAKFEAWVHGPVIADIYHEYKEYGFNEIKQVDNPELTLTEDVEDLLNQVFEAYSQYNGNELEALTHAERPWIEARGDASPLEPSHSILNDKTIYEFYYHRMVD